MKEYPEEGLFWDLLDVLTGILIVSGIVGIVYYAVYFGRIIAEG